MRISIRLKLVAPALLGALVIFVGVNPASAATAAPALMLHVLAAPTHFSSADTEGCLANEEAGCDRYEVTVTNAGSEPASGPITLTDALPAGLQVLHVRFFLAKNEQSGLGNEAPEGVPLVGSEGEALEETPGTTCKPNAVPVTCEFAGSLEPDQRLQMQVLVTVEPGAASALNTTTVAEGGNPVASTSADDVIGTLAPPFGPSALLSDVTGIDGALDRQAGDHPYEYVTRIDFNTKIGLNALGRLRPGPGQHGVRDVVLDLPLGLLGSVTSTPRCTFAQLQSYPSGCPQDTEVGHIATESDSPVEANGALYNMVPPHGVAAEFGFIDILATTHVLDVGVVPTPAGYALRATGREIPDASWTDIITTFYGDPATKSGAGSSLAQLTNPSDCSGGPLDSTVYLDSWEHPGSFNADGTPNVDGPGSVGWASASSESPPVTGCNALRFTPSSFSFQPETTTANSPTGATLDLKVPQTETPETLATPPLRNATVTLPEGLTVDPSAAGGLQACSEAEIGWNGAVAAQGGHPANPGYSNFDEEVPSCPEASRIGSVEVASPLLPTTLQGSVYLATQYENPYGSLLGGYIVIDDPATGTIVKIPGELRTNPATGQITGIFDDNPQIPFSDLKIHFFGGSRGDLATPEACGTYTTTSDFEPWSAPESGPDATPSSSFSIDTGCVSGFTPAFSAGTTSNQGGSFSPFTLSFSRQDDEAGLAGLTVSLPAGLLGKIAGVAECSEGQIAAAAASSGAAEQASPSCPSSSQLGTVTAATGPGPNPFVVGGKAYLTGPYRGAPYGLVVVVPAVAGPFDLGTVVIRQALFIDPKDAHVTAVSDPFPTILKGIPLRIKSVSVALNRPEFMFNPSSCNPMAITGGIGSTQGASAPVSSHFQVADCASLKFAPKFSASTAGAATPNGGGASFHVKLVAKEGPFSGNQPGEANVKRVDVQLPKLLPARLTTLQKACTAAQFAADPAGCPAFSFVGTATARTPVLNNPLTGPAILVSHGGEAFPDLVIVLQGEGVVLDLVGNTQIKRGITYSRFEAVPDAPISSFELDLPQSPHSALASSSFTGFCGQDLKMPTSMEAQDGAVLSQDTSIEITGCKPSISITKRKLAGNSVLVTVKTTVQGIVTITGPGLRKTHETLAPGSHTITVPIGATSRRVRSQRYKIKLRAALKAGGKTVSKTISLKL